VVWVRAVPEAVERKKSVWVPRHACEGELASVFIFPFSPPRPWKDACNCKPAVGDALWDRASTIIFSGCTHKIKTEYYCTAMIRWEEIALWSDATAYAYGVRVHRKAYLLVFLKASWAISSHVLWSFSLPPNGRHLHRKAAALSCRSFFLQAIITVVRDSALPASTSFLLYWLYYSVVSKWVNF